jgi:hypothetical protein
MARDSGVTPAIPRTSAGPLARVSQRLPDGGLADPRRHVREKLAASGLLAGLARHGSVAITAGSRGMGEFAAILSGVADAVRDAGGEPFLVPAMGSHGGATAEGQAEILRRLGVRPDTVPAPVRAGMETDPLGAAATGAVAHIDRIAHRAQGVIVLGRVTLHPESDSALASGLLKMLVVGLGNQNGAREAHSHGLWDSVREVPRITLARARILCGVAVVENAWRRPVCIEVAAPRYQDFLRTDRRLLEVARANFARLPFDALDLLVVDRLGKDVSGSGMDLNVIGSWRVSGGKRAPDFRRIAVLSLTSGSLGNGLGIGLADTTTQRFARSFDAAATWVNLLTASEPGVLNTLEGKLPLVLPCDRDAIEVALHSSLAGPRARICRIRSTADLGQLWCSEALLDEVRRSPSLQLEEPPAPWPYDAGGNLLPARGE